MSLNLETLISMRCYAKNNNKKLGKMSPILFMFFIITFSILIRNAAVENLQLIIYIHNVRKIFHLSLNFFNVKPNMRNSSALDSMRVAKLDICLYSSFRKVYIGCSERFEQLESMFEFLYLIFKMIFRKLLKMLPKGI